MKTYFSRALLWRAYIIAGLSGMSVMIMELVASRVLAPYLGTSIIVWTSIIGVIMASLAVGYWIGGKLADTRASFAGLSQLSLVASVLLSFSIVLQIVWLPYIPSSGNIYLQAIGVTLLLFGPASVALAAVSPYTSRLLMSGLDEAGATVGRVSAFSTTGSIIGTFLTGFVLVAWLGSTAILIGLTILLWLLSLIASARGFVLARVVSMLLIGLVIMLQAVNLRTERNLGITTVDTQYSHVQVRDGELNGKPVRHLMIGDVVHSSIYLNESTIVHDYIAGYQLTDDLLPNPKNALMIGGAAFTYPRAFMANHPDSKVTVVEIDPGIVALAKRDFGLVDSPRLTIAIQDGRRYLNQAVGRGESYDLVIGDAFGSFYSIPFELTTKEASERVRALLTENGLYAVNIIASRTGERSGFLDAYVRTLRTVFPQVDVFPVQAARPDQSQNLIILARMQKGGTPESVTAGKVPTVWSNQYLDPLPGKAEILTDEYAPTDRYLLPLVKRT